MCPHLVTQHVGHVPVVPELGRVSGEQCVSCEDGHGSQDEGGKQVGVDEVPCAAQSPVTQRRTQALSSLISPYRRSHLTAHISPYRHSHLSSHRETHLGGTDSFIHSPVKGAVRRFCCQEMRTPLGL